VEIRESVEKRRRMRNTGFGGIAMIFSSLLQGEESGV